MDGLRGLGARQASAKGVLAESGVNGRTQHLLPSVIRGNALLMVEDRIVNLPRASRVLAAGAPASNGCGHGQRVDTSEREILEGNWELKIVSDYCLEDIVDLSATGKFEIRKLDKRGTSRFKAQSAARSEMDDQSQRHAK